MTATTRAPADGRRASASIPTAAPLRAAVIAGLLAAAELASAQPAPVLEEIVVTAQKRPESLQDVPVSVNVTAGERLTSQAIDTIEALQLYVPGLRMAETALGSNLFIRGIGSGVNQGFEQSAGIYVDGIYHGRAQLTRLPFFDMERIEVLRGPQTILFGKNSIAGALNLVTASPTPAFEAQLLTRYEPELGESELGGVLSGPLTERVRGRVAIRSSRSDGYIDNAQLGRDEPRRDDRGVRIGLAWDVSSTLALSLKAETSSFDVTGRQVEVIFDRPAAAGPFAGLTYGQILTGVFGQPPSVLDARLDGRRASNGDVSRNDVDDAVFAADWRLGTLRLSSITGFSGYEYAEVCDCDFTSADVFTGVLREEFEQISQELRIASEPGRRLEYIAGAYVQSNDTDFFDSLLIGDESVLVSLVDAASASGQLPLPPMSGTQLLADTAAPRFFTQRSRLAALFGRLTWHLGDVTRLSFGGRFVREKKTATRAFDLTRADGTALDPAVVPLTTALYNTLFNATPHFLDGDRVERKFVPSVTFEWDVSGEALLYASIVRGFKSGGFDARSNNPPSNPLFPASSGSFEFEDEEVRSIEVGTKIRFGAGRAELYAAAYDMDYDDLQVSTYDGTLGFNVGNAGAARVRGLEIEGRYRVGENLRLTGGIALTDFEFEEYIGQCHFGRPPDAADGVNCDYRGRTNQYLADWSGRVSADGSVPIGDRLAVRWVLDLLFTGDHSLAPTLHPDVVQDAYLKLNGRVSFGDADGKWEVALLAENLTDETILTYGNELPLAGTTFGAPGAFAFVAPPRSVALQAILRFR